MSDSKVDGKTKNCEKCKTPLICIKILKTWNNQTSEKLQWQNRSNSKPHYKFAGEKNGATTYECQKPLIPEVATVDPTLGFITDFTKEDTLPDSSPLNPFEEAKAIVAWASKNAFAKAREGLDSSKSLDSYASNQIGQKEGMLTRAYIDTTLKLMELHNIKTRVWAN